MSEKVKYPVVKVRDSEGNAYRCYRKPSGELLDADFYDAAFATERINGFKLSLDALRQVNKERGIEWTGPGPITWETVLFMTTELAGEVGEAANVIKKLARQAYGWKGGISEETGRDMLLEELADIVICVDRLAEVFNIDLNTAIRDKFNKTSLKNGLNTKIE